jgi:hypothetical protein
MYKIHMKNPNSKISPVEQHKRAWWRVMLLALSLLAVGLLTGSCGAMKHTPTNTSTEVHMKDSTIFHIKDSIRVIPIERYIDIVRPVDTLTLETSLAKATAYYDSTFNVLRGEIHNKKQVEEKTRIIYKDRLVYRDSLVFRDVPVEIIKEKEKKVYPRWLVLLSILGITLTGLEGFKIYLKIKKKLPLG